MPNQFVVPQFLEVEPKIFSFVTMRQFLIMLGVLVLEFAVYRIFLNIIYVILFGVPILAIGIMFAFAKVNGQPFHFIVLSFIQTWQKPHLRIWDKTLNDQDLRVFLEKVDEEVAPAPVRKAPIERSRLNELTLVVNTGGVYESEENV